MPMPHALLIFILKILLFFDYLVSRFTKIYIFLVDAFSEKNWLSLKTWKPIIESSFSDFINEGVYLSSVKLLDFVVPLIIN